MTIKQGERYNRVKTLERNRDNALFVGFSPAEHPEIVVSVMIENGEAGGRVAGPVVRQIMNAWLLDQDGHLKAQYATPQKKTGRSSRLTGAASARMNCPPNQAGALS